MECLSEIFQFLLWFLLLNSFGLSAIIKSLTRSGKQRRKRNVQFKSSQDI